MSFADDAAALERSFRSTSDLLQKVLQGLVSRRAAWISARPKVLAPSQELEHLTSAIAVEEQARAALLQRLRTALPMPFGGDATAQHINVSRVVAALPTTSGRSLREASDAANRLAKAVRTEVSLGQRLLRFAQNAQNTALADASQARALPGYDRTARVLRAGGAGALIDGRM